jgi:hypothetical protein
LDYFVVPGRLPTTPSQNKIFGVGLSRTGTTSLASALHSIGIKTHHANFHTLDFTNSKSKPTIRKEYVDMFDAQTDIQISLVFEQLADLYPDSKFILTKRNPKLWAAAAQRFFIEDGVFWPITPYLWPITDILWEIGLFPIPCHTFFSQMYGNDYLEMPTSKWEQVYLDFEERVRSYFALSRNKGRLLEMDITKGDGWEILGPFLGVNNSITIINPGPLPRVYVKAFTFTTQVKWQLMDLWKWIEFWLH